MNCLSFSLYLSYTNTYTHKLTHSYRVIGVFGERKAQAQIFKIDSFLTFIRMIQYLECKRKSWYKNVLVFQLFLVFFFCFVCFIFFVIHCVLNSNKKNHNCNCILYILKNKSQQLFSCNSRIASHKIMCNFKIYYSK